MRKIVNISLTEELARDVERAMEEGQYASKSEFFRDLLRSWKEARVLKELRESQQEFVQGKGKVLRSLKNIRFSQDEDRWEEVVDLTKVRKGGVDIDEVLARL